MAEIVRAAVVNYEVRGVSSHDEFLSRLVFWIDQAVSQGANLVVFPESIDLELLSLAPDLPDEDTAEFLAQYSPLTFEFVRSQSQQRSITIIGGSHMSKSEAGFVNRCPIARNGSLTFQDKVNLTQYELDPWNLSPGAGLNPVDEIGVTICYDSEFPVSGRILAEHGVLIQVVPAYTEMVYGFNRVRWSCQARAVEHQNYVIHASLVGSLGREPVPSTYGSSAILCPSCEPYPPTGILAETELNRAGMAIADLDLALITLIRNQGDVRNWNDRSLGDFEVKN